MSPIAILALLLGSALVLALLLLLVQCYVISARRAKRTITFARTGDLLAESEHPRLIDLDSGHEYEWITGFDFDDPDAGGYANVLDHDFAWPREDLERVAPLVELRSLDPSQIEQLRRTLDQ